MYKQLRVIERERVGGREVANLDEKLAIRTNKRDIQRLTIENDRLRNKETRELGFRGRGEEQKVTRGRFGAVVVAMSRSRNVDVA